MKKATLIFILWAFFVFITVFKLYIFPRWFLILMFLFWIFVYYLGIHYENKRARVPKPVYLADPE